MHNRYFWHTDRDAGQSLQTGTVPVKPGRMVCLVKCHMSASQVLIAPTYYTTLTPNDVLPDPNFCNQCTALKAHSL